MSKVWWAPLTGVAFVIVVIVSFVVGGEPPSADDPVQEIVDFYTDDADAIRIGAALSALAGALLIFFAGTLRQVLKEAEGPNGTLSLIAFSGAVVVAVAAAVDATILFATAEAAEDIEPASVQTLQALWDNDFLPFVMGLFVLLVAAGLSILRHGALPKWLGWTAIVLGVLAMTPAGFIAFSASALWVIAASVLLTMRARGAGDAPPPPPSAGPLPA
jgi:Domain of unknown function (DUF4386)